MILKQIIFRVLCYFCRQIGFSPAESIRKIKEAFPLSNLPDSTLYQYYRETVSVNDIILKEPIIPDRINHILEEQLRELIKDSQFQSSHKLASIVKKAQSTVYSYLHDHLHLHYGSCNIIPHELTEELRESRKNQAKVIMAVLTELKPVDYEPLMATDETWLYYYNSPTHCYYSSESSPATVIRDSISQSKQMYIPILSTDGIIGEYYLQKGKTVDSQTWIAKTLQQADRWWKSKWRTLTTERQSAIRACIEKAKIQGLNAITALHLHTFEPSPDPSEGLVVCNTPSKVSQSISSSQDEAKEEDDDHHTEDLRVDLPHRDAAKQSENSLKQYPLGYLEASQECSDFESTQAQTNQSTRKREEPTSTESDSSIPRCFIQWDNARVHTSRASREALHHTSLQRLTHPAYSPDLAVCDFFYFGFLKESLRSALLSAQSLQTLSAAITHFNVSLRKSESIKKSFDSLLERARYVSEHNGDYYSRNHTHNQSIIHHAASQSLNSQTTPSESHSTLSQRTRSTRGIIALENIDSQHCYLISLLQCFLSNLAFVNHILSDIPTIRKDITPDRTPLLFYFINLIETTWMSQQLPQHFTNLYQEDRISKETPVETVYSIPVFTPTDIVTLTHTATFGDNSPYQDAAELFQLLWEQMACYHIVVLY